MTAAETVPPPLAHLHGARPPAPQWFTDALAVTPERSTFTHEGAEIELLAWGKVGNPGLLLVHGGMAHADWWSFIAPFFAKTHRVAALSLSGMGRSSWREKYDTLQYAGELIGAIKAAGLDKAAVMPVVMGHSFGGLPTMAAGALHGDKLAAVIALDSPLFSPEQRKARADRRPPSKPPRDTIVYPSEAAALSRFRFSPPQHSGNLYIADHIARHSLRQVKAADGSPGWTWRFDPFMWSRMTRREPSVDMIAVKTRLAVMWGSKSALVESDVVDFWRTAAPKGRVLVEIPEAAHHVMVDEPLALVTAVRGLLGGWGLI